MTIVKLSNTTHNEMDNNANKDQRIEIQKYVIEFLNGRYKRTTNR